ncbi:hypothetical protein [Priestia aryabhattai]|uniref:hypothetical protein n=1 Tax=Priestia aryabhattai TaxID=412384 RepID=UPI003CF2797B
MEEELKAILERLDKLDMTRLDIKLDTDTFDSVITVMERNHKEVMERFGEIKGLLQPLQKS